MNPEVMVATPIDPDKPAAVDARSGQSVSYRYFRLATAEMGAALQGRGVGPGDRVAIVSPNSIDHLIAWYGVLWTGATVADLNFLLSQRALANIVRDCDPKLVLVGGEAPADLGSTFEGVPLERLDLWNSHPAVCGSAARHSGDLAVIAYTSGTTGEPKGVVHTDRAVEAQLRLLTEVCGYDDSWTSYVAIPLFSVHGFLPQVAAVLKAGGTVVIDQKFEGAALAKASRLWEISYTTLTSAMLPGLLALRPGERPDLSKIRVLTCGGAPLPSQLRKEFEATYGVHLTQGYSCTEVLGAFVMDLDGRAPAGAAGRVYPQNQNVVEILDDNGKPAPLGEPGEIVFRRQYALHEYWGQPEETAQAFTGGEWYATGDIGRIDSDGFLYVLDRKKDMIIRGGFNLYPAGIESVLLSCPRVTEAVVVGVADGQLGEVPVAFVVPGEPAPTAEELQALVLSDLGKTHVPAAIHLVSADLLPRSDVGKVMKNVLRDRLRAGAFDSDRDGALSSHSHETVQPD
jgi:long-chain acyl-CoA synthetase